MSVAFEADEGLVVVPVQVTGPSGLAILRLALDTGATRTLINTSLLVAVGYDPAASPDRKEVTTGSGVEFVALLQVMKMVALGRERNQFPGLPTHCRPVLASMVC